MRLNCNALSCVKRRSMAMKFNTIIYNICVWKTVRIWIKRELYFVKKRNKIVQVIKGDIGCKLANEEKNHKSYDTCLKKF